MMTNTVTARRRGDSRQMLRKQATFIAKSTAAARTATPSPTPIATAIVTATGHGNDNDGKQFTASRTPKRKRGLELDEQQ